MHWIETLMKQAGKVRLGQDAVMVEDLQQVLKDNRAAVRANQQQIMGPGFEPKGDENLIRIESPDNTHLHLPGPAGVTAASLAKLVMSLGVLACGGGLPIAGWLVADAIRSKPAAAAPPVPIVRQPRPVPSTPPAVMPDVPNWRLELVPEDETPFAQQ